MVKTKDAGHVTGGSGPLARAEGWPGQRGATECVLSSKRKVVKGSLWDDHCVPGQDGPERGKVWRGRGQEVQAAAKTIRSRQLPGCW